MTGETFNPNHATVLSSSESSKFRQTGHFDQNYLQDTGPGITIDSRTKRNTSIFKIRASYKNSGMSPQQIVTLANPRRLSAGFTLGAKKIIKESDNGTQSDMNFDEEHKSLVITDKEYKYENGSPD